MGLFTVATQTSSKVPSLAPLLEAGGYPARVCGIVDLGKQPGSPMYPEPAYKMRVTFELLDEYMKETNEAGEPVMVQDPDEDEGVMMQKNILDKPRWFDFDFTYNPDGFMGDGSHIYKFMKAVDALEVAPNPIAVPPVAGHPAKELQTLLGEPLVVGLSSEMQKGGKKAGQMVNKVKSFAPMKSKEKRDAKELVNPTMFFNLGEPDLEVFNKLPGGESPWAVKNLITSNLGFNGSKLQAALGITATATASEPVTNTATEAQVDEALAKELAAQQAARAAAAENTEGGETTVLPF